MTDFFKKIISEQIRKHGLRTDSELNLSFLKIQNGEGHLFKKVVFPVFINGDQAPSYAVYCARAPISNDTLRISVNHLAEHFEEAPEFFFEGSIHGLYYALVAYISYGRSSLANSIERSAMFERSLKKPRSTYTTVSLMSFAEGLSHVFAPYDALGADKHTSSLFRELKDYKDIHVPLVSQHGDFQESNIFFQNGRMLLIDWDDFGFTDFPLFDFFSLCDQARRRGVSDSELRERWIVAAKAIGLPVNLKSTLYRVYLMINFIRKERIRNIYLREQRLDNLYKSMNSVN